ncbi:formimidoyltetrahydrofolate cyclodeaminase [Keratinibaculum paraultunense]|uniref:Formimidoyltetrahydrofolate cyclodeaminase n=1 Tax=Keratinibaculum paraultunense TaxID=1278232 RepID=A0A4R3KQ94_9FIRM|nr:cyclodeaminase/cyclohydrolase family protein [Keratinibaculum paraultunense]QQY79747.1 cyclodeaminase/cyclohydrolase family protein [Keratinibaculum paraultunense]TCS86944.1 formimidoyltetrahydrofolate cyclodeaminase [Keratinibaculum paraultunense]
MLIKETLEDFIDKVASKEPTPGGGSVSALAGSLGAALTFMVGNLTFGKKAYEELDEEVKEEMNSNFKELQKSIEKLNKIVDEDTKAFDKVMEAFKMPKETEEEKTKRNAAIQEGYKKALEVPLKCAEECFRVLKLQDVFAHYGNINAITDVGVGTLLAAAGLEGALLNVKINLLSIKDEVYRNEMEKKIEELLNEGIKLKKELMKIVYKRLG